MNFRTVLHLLKTDWRRFNIPIIGMWVCLLISMAPWLTHDPASFEVPLPYGSSSSGNLASLGLPRSFDRPLHIQLSAGLAMILPVLLSTAIGMHGHSWQSVSPIRRWQRVMAKTLALVLFVVLPQLVLESLVPVRNGFSASYVTSHAVQTGVMLVFLHGTFAVLGRCCGSVWSWSAAVACFLGLSHLTDSMFVAPALMGMLDWRNAIQTGALDWTRTVAGFVLVVSLPWILRSRAGSVTAIAAAVLGLVAASWPGTWHDFRPDSWRSDTALDSIQPALSRQDLHRGTVTEWQFGRTRTRQSLMATIDAKGLQPGVFVRWRSPNVSPHFINRFLFHGSNDTAREALGQILPAPISVLGRYQEFVDLGMDGTDHLPADVVLTGAVFRYRMVADLPLVGNTVEAKCDDIITAARYIDDEKRGPLAEISIKCPVALTGGSDSYFTCMLYLPEPDRCVFLQSAYSERGYSAGGIAWTRQVMEVEHPDHGWSRSWKNARLLVIQPEFLGAVSRRLPLSSPVVGMTPHPREWMLSQVSDTRNGAYYSHLRPHRPDPATCTEKEFARYLRSLIGLFPSGIIVRDLAEYAPRFPHLLALYSHELYVTMAVENGVPESAKDEVVSAVDGPLQVMKLARVLTKRGWDPPARDRFLACLKAPFLSRNSSDTRLIASAVARMEDPSTYPTLLQAYETTGDPGLYETVRSLPGIARELDEVVERVSHRLSTATNLEGGVLRGTSAIEEFLGPVSHGSPVALAKLLQVCQDPDIDIFLPGSGLEEIIMLLPVPKNQKAWHGFLRGKTAADFTYDSLARCWHPISKTP